MTGGGQMTLESWLSRLRHRPDPETLLQGFVPPPRFRHSRFSTYRPDPSHTSQQRAVTRLRHAAHELAARTGAVGRFRELVGKRGRGRGIYLDGGFGVGKTHLLAALWHAAPGPRAYLSFDELVYTIGLLGVPGTREVFRDHRLAAIDEWELDDPGNLKLALAWLRGALADGLLVAVTSNTIPDELGRGRFSQKSFAGEIEELAGAFEVLTIGGEDFRHRHFQADPGREYFCTPEHLERRAAQANGAVLLTDFSQLVGGLGRVHPIQFGGLVERLDLLLIREVVPIADLAEGLRWVHFVDKLYDAAVPLAASSGVRLSDLFPAGFFTGGFGKKFGRCLSRMEELLGDRASGERPARQETA